jgi:hypothetical protein
VSLTHYCGWAIDAGPVTRDTARVVKLIPAHILHARRRRLRPGQQATADRLVATNQASLTALAQCRGASNTLGLACSSVRCAGVATAWRALCQQLCCRCWRPNSACCRFHPRSRRTLRPAVPTSHVCASNGWSDGGRTAPVRRRTRATCATCASSCSRQRWSETRGPQLGLRR